jgi:cyanophycinase
MWEQAGARSAARLDLANPASGLEALGKATLIWMPGGSQSRLVDALAQTQLLDAIRAAHRRGATVGGTSAGAAALSSVMIAGPGSEPSLSPTGVELAAGLGLAPDLVVDQHFISRGRMPRLLAAVLTHPGRVGIGVPEDTAAVIAGNVVRVVGPGPVVVIDARGATVPAADDQASALDVRLHVLSRDMEFPLERTQ